MFLHPPVPHSSSLSPQAFEKFIYENKKIDKAE
jgi:hypothetical protein